MELIVRRARPDDVSDILEIERSCFTSDFISEDEILAALDTCRVLTVGQNAAGYCLWYNDYDNNPGNCYLYSLAIHKYYRRRGLSRLLLDSFLSAESSIHSLHVSVGNKAAITLYESVGFTPIETIEQFYEDRGSALLMLKRNEDES